MENKNISKPISLVIDDARKSIVQTINDLNLHITLIEMIMKELYTEVQEQAEITRKRELNEYNKKLAELSEEAKASSDIATEEEENE